MEWNRFKDKMLADPEVKAHYEELGPYYHLIQQLVELRKQQSVTQKQIAIAMGTSQSAIARLESGNTNVTLETLARFAEVLNCRLSLTHEPLPDKTKPSRQTSPSPV